MKFEWDKKKAQSNLKKHKVSFDEAVEVFDDPLSITILDPLHSEDEERFTDIGITKKKRLLVVSYTERGSKIRIITCREATAAERKKYEENQR